MLVSNTCQKKKKVNRNQEKVQEINTKQMYKFHLMHDIRSILGCKKFDKKGFNDRKSLPNTLTLIVKLLIDSLFLYLFFNSNNASSN